MKRPTSLFCLGALLILMSFSNNPESTVVGTYGNPYDGVAGMQLTLNEDHTFVYLNKNDDKDVRIEGTWTMKGENVVLESTSEKVKFPKVWSFENEGKAAKTRQGLTFYRLCKV